jgi:hypothetical protein
MIEEQLVGVLPIIALKQYMLDTEDLHCLRLAMSKKLLKKSKIFKLTILLANEIVRTLKLLVFCCDFVLIISQYEMKVLEPLLKLMLLCCIIYRFF